MKTSSNNVVQATCWMLLTIVAFGALAVIGRELAKQLSLMQMMCFRSILALLIIGVIAQRQGWLAKPTTQWRLHWARNTTHFFGVYTWYFGIVALPLAEVFAIEFTTPIWATLVAIFLLGERLTWPKFIAVAFGFIGVFIIVRPGFREVEPAAWFMLLGAVSYGFSASFTKIITRRDSSAHVILYMMLMQTALSGVYLLLSLFWETPQIPEYAELYWVLAGLVASAILALFAHYCMTRALAIADVSVVIPISFLRLPFIAVVGYFLYAEKIDWFVLLGASIMLLGNIINLRAAKRAGS